MKKNDFYLIGGILIILLISVLLMQLLKSEGSKVLITIDGKEYKTLNLNEETTYTIHHDHGGWNTLEIKDGNVKMLDASCPDKLCVMQNKIHFDNETITCLPNRVVLKIIGGEKGDLDAISN